MLTEDLTRGIRRIRAVALCCLNSGPPSAAAAQHLNNIGSMSGVSWASEPGHTCTPVRQAISSLISSFRLSNTFSFFYCIPEYVMEGKESWPTTTQVCQHILANGYGKCYNLKGLAQAKIIKKSEILFWHLHMTI